MRALLIASLAVIFAAVSLVVAFRPFSVEDNSDFNNMDLLKAINSFMCSAGSENCVDVNGGENDFTDLKEKVVRRILDFAYDMVRPTTVKHLAVRSQFPRDVKEMFDLASKLFVSPSGSAFHSKRENQRAAIKAVRGAVDKLTNAPLEETKYPYWRWIPQYAGDAHIGSSASFPTKCFGSVTVSAEKTSANSIMVKTSPQHEGFLCSDWILMVVGGKDFRIQMLDSNKVLNWEFDLTGYTTENTWYLNRHGVRILKFPESLLATIGSLLDTVDLLAGFAEPVLTNSTFMDNYNFLRTYTEFSPRMGPKTVLRSAGDVVAQSGIEDQIQSGDGAAVLRNDGMDPMLTWAAGATMGHTVIFMRNKQDVLHICESTTKDAYWPANGLQCTPYKQWVKQVAHATMSVVWMPLAPEYRKKFDADKAWAFFEQHMGVNYGFANMIFSWVDTLDNNFPCIPPNFDICLMRQAVEQLCMILDRLQGPANTNIFRQAINFRSGLIGQNEPVLTAMYHAATVKNLTFPDLYSMPENDNWMYNMTANNGTFVRSVSSVCCVFVCRMWKAAGIFSEINDQLNCGEQALWDIWSMKIFDSNREGEGRPEICKKTDPNNNLCQLMGPETLHVEPNHNSRPLYPWMGQKCSSRCPDYVREDGC